MRAGEVWIGPADVHLEVTADLHMRLSHGRPVSGCIPSVDVLFDSMARSQNGKALGLVMTGMGRDGTKGLRAMRGAGCMTAAQDASSCVVYGMPRSAKESGAAMYEVPLSYTVEFLVRATRGR
jgi:two-component system chemotaxis response regulator CheB